MVEMRWVPLKLAKSMASEYVVAEDHLRRVLQYRHNVFNGYDSDGVPVVSGWSDWIDVPTVTDPTV